MKLDVPYFSQRSDVHDSDWKDRACGIVCLKMVLEFEVVGAGLRTPSLEELIEEGVYVGGHTKAGWKHDALVILAHNHGVHAYREEFKSRVIDIEKRISSIGLFEHVLAMHGMRKIVHTLENGLPVIVSLSAGLFSDKNTHLVVLTGVEHKNDVLTGFYCHDPSESSSQKGAHKFLPIDTFEKYWRKMAIFVEGHIEA